MDKNKKLFYTIISAISALAAATAAFLALKKHRCAEQKLIEEIATIISVSIVVLAIPYGSVMTYGEIAKILAKQRGVAKMSAQAVGGAVGHNPISIIVPCHRVVGTNGNLTGYAGGIDKKISLFKIEKTDVKKLIQKFPERIN